MQCPWPVLFASVFACSTVAPDPTSTREPSVLGSGKRVRELMNPELPDHPARGASVSVSGAVVLWVDGYAETGSNNSKGAYYVQDLGSGEPYSGVSLFAPSFIPANLRVAPGDVLDLRGTYEELPNIGTAVFPEGQVLAQLSRPVGTFRYEHQSPAPKEIDPTDLNSYESGRRWLGMLVTVRDVTIDQFLSDDAGRVSAHLTADTRGVTTTNELTEIRPADFPPKTHFSSVTGIVTWFYSFHIAPRTLADLAR